MSRFLLRCRDAERAILPGIRCPVCLLISVFRRIPGIPVVKIVPGIDLYSDNYTKKKKPGFRKFRLDSSWIPEFRVDSGFRTSVAMFLYLFA